MAEGGACPQFHGDEQRLDDFIVGCAGEPGAAGMQRDTPLTLGGEGDGSYAVEALIASDFAPVQGFVLAMAILYVVLNLLIDMVYGLIDPRVRVS